MTIKTQEQIDRMHYCAERKCKFMSVYTYTCDYCLIKGVHRPCPPGKKCTAWKEEGPENKATMPPIDLGKKRKRTTLNRNHFERMWKMYQQGLNDREISEEIGCSQTAVRRWRYRNSLPPNDKKRRVK